MAVATDNDRPIIDGDIVQHFVNDIRHGVILAFWVARRNKAKLIHKGHEAWRIRLRLTVPNRGGVAARLVCAIDTGRQKSRRHGFQFLRGHQTGRVLAADNIDLHADIGTGMQRLV